MLDLLLSVLFGAAAISFIHLSGTSIAYARPVRSLVFFASAIVSAILTLHSIFVGW